MVGSRAIHLNSFKIFKNRDQMMESKKRVEFMKDDFINYIVTRTSDTIERLMSYPKCRSVEVINNPARPGSNHREVNCINYK